MQQIAMPSYHNPPACDSKAEQLTTVLQWSQWIPEWPLSLITILPVTFFTPWKLYDTTSPCCMGRA